MAALVADTHAAIWYLLDDPRLSGAAGSAMDEANAAGDPILISAITLVELTYLVEKGRVPALARTRLLDSLESPTGPWELAPVDLEVAAAVTSIDRTSVPDMPDRVIAATALARNAPLVSRDRRILIAQTLDELNTRGSREARDRHPARRRGHVDGVTGVTGESDDSICKLVGSLS